MAVEPSPEFSAGDACNAAPRVRELDRISRRGLWALPVWALFLFLGTLTHQPDTRTDFAGFARYVTTTEFLIGHIVYSVIGGAIGVLGLFALFGFLALRGRSRLATVGLVAAVLGDVMITAVFGMAAFAQPAVGRHYLSGHTDEAIAVYDDMYGAPLSMTAAAGVLLLVTSVVCLGIAIVRSRFLPRGAGIGMAVGIVVFGVIGAITANVVQSMGAALLIASTIWVASAGKRAPAL